MGDDAGNQSDTEYQEEGEMSKKTVQFTIDEAGLIRQMLDEIPGKGMDFGFAQRLGRVWGILELTEEESEERPEHIERQLTSTDRQALITALLPPLACWTLKGLRDVGKPILLRLGWKEPPVQDMEDDEDD